MSDIVKREQTQLQQGGAVGRGFENVNMEEITMPVVKVMQPTSPELQEEDIDFRQGDFVHTLFLEKVDPAVFIPISLSDPNILFTPRDESDWEEFKASIMAATGVELSDTEKDSMIICRAIDGRNGSRFGKCAECRLNKFNDETGEKPLCTANIAVLGLFGPEQHLAVFQFNNTSYKHGRRFKSMTLFGGGDIFSRKYKLSSVRKSEGGNTWYEVMAKPAGKTTEEEYKAAEEMYQQFAGKVIVAEEEPPEEVQEDDAEF